VSKPFDFLMPTVAQNNSQEKPLEAVNPSFVIDGFNSPGIAHRSPEKRQSARDSYVHSGTTTKHFSKRKSRKKTSETLGIKRKTKLRLVELLHSLGEVESSESMGNCGEKWTVVTCGEHIAAKIPFHRCNIRFCPLCGSRRANRFVKKYLAFASEFVKQNPRYMPCLLTLTQKKIKGESKKEARARILKSFKQLIRRKFFAEYFAGGIWANEVTESQTGNHSHLHIVIFRRKFIDAKLLKAEWSKVSPDAKNLNIRLIDSLEKGLRECIKYISKPIPAENLTLTSVKEILELKGLRMIDTFGEFRSFYRDFELPEADESESDKVDFVIGECCPTCSKPLFEQIISDVELIAYHRRRERIAANQIRDKLKDKFYEAQKE
jgi:hypothetical protein